MQEEKKHGGKRAGAGRKTNRPKITVALSLPTDIVEWLDSIGGEGYRSATATMILDSFMKEDKQVNK